MGIIAKVKQVVSGDTLLLKSTKTAIEKTLSLAYVTAPRLRRDGDEPYAFQSRDFLRKLVVGKEVQFTVMYTVASMSRDYGTVMLQDGRSLTEELIVNGIVKLRDDAGRREDQPENDEFLGRLQQLQDQAKTARRGVWSTEDGRYEVLHDVSDMKEFLDEYKGKQIDAIVERVISGDRLAVRLILNPKKHQQLVILIAGIRTAASSRTDAQGNPTGGEEFGDEAKSFVEERLLQRTVKIVPLGASPSNQLIGKVLHPAGNISELILSQGFARCVDFHSTMVGPDMAKLRAAEQAAKDRKLRLFKTHVVKAKETGNSFDTTVGRIINPDTIIVRNKAGAERKINLSSVRQPKPSDPKQQPFQAEAKEFLRKKIIAKHVRVNIDGKRPPSDGYEEREMATVIFNGQNIALLLVENGYASVIRHRREDEDRSPIYDDLLAAEDAAQKAQKGMWSPKPPASGKMVEASETIQKAKGYLSFLQRQKRIPAVVDFVASGARFKVIIPRENARLTFVLSGIRAPRTARNESEKSEPFGPEAHDWSSKKCMQRDVEIDVEDLDRVGGFIGTMYIARENVALGLVSEGLASVHAYSAEKTGHAAELLAAESRAKAARKALWKDWTPEADADESADPVQETNGKPEKFEKKRDFRDVVVTDISDECKLKVQLVGAGTAGFDDMMARFQTFHLNPANAKGLEGPPHAGSFVAAKFTEDGRWYRARVRHVDRAASTAEVSYIDYGNSERLPFARLRALPADFSQTKVKPLAVDAVFSFIDFPPPTRTEYATSARDLVDRMMEGGQAKLLANVDREEGGVLSLTLYDPRNCGDAPKVEMSLNAEVVDAGLAMVAMKLRAWEKEAHKDEIAKLREIMEEAKEERRGMWEYGDITDYDG